ncbi:MAG: NAD(P)H-dependent oxidoreductase, partial [Gammaproteobacteria bacterium]|nr:NAD(P)H-dependent oxidoreductase [Gammaproteobacteria bacterium]
MPLKILCFLGSARQSAPPRPARLGLRVARACIAHLATGEHVTRLVDPLEIELPSVFKPQFAYPEGRAPAALNALAGEIESADGYVMVSPEYNHSMSPALSHLLNHFGSSLLSWKPSAIVTYSAGQWGGVRAAVGMRSFLAELGCLPVSAMIHVPRAQDVLDEDGVCLEGVDASAWHDYMARTFTQLEWWATAGGGPPRPPAPPPVWDPGWPNPRPPPPP